MSEVAWTNLKQVNRPPGKVTLDQVMVSPSLMPGALSTPEFGHFSAKAMHGHLRPFQNRLDLVITMTQAASCTCCGILHVCRVLDYFSATHWYDRLIQENLAPPRSSTTVYNLSAGDIGSSAPDPTTCILKWCHDLGTRPSGAYY